jgi:hypothetical protein
MDPPSACANVSERLRASEIALDKGDIAGNTAREPLITSEGLVCCRGRSCEHRSPHCRIAQRKQACAHGQPTRSSFVRSEPERGALSDARSLWKPAAWSRATSRHQQVIGRLRSGDGSQAQAQRRCRLSLRDPRFRRLAPMWPKGHRRTRMPHSCSSGRSRRRPSRAGRERPRRSSACPSS